MPQRNVATNFTFEQQRLEINLLAQDFWTQKGTVDTAASTYLKHNGSNAFTGNTLNVPSAFTINSDTGNGTVTIAGNLQVNGTTTTVNTATMDVVDKNITIAKGSANDAAADGAGITIDSDTDITFNFVDAKDALVSSIGLEATTFLKGPYGQFTGSGTPSAGQGVEVNAPDANTGQIASYDRGNSAYKDLRLKGASVAMYAGTTNALIGGFHNTGLIMETGKTITGDLTGTASGNAVLTGSTNNTIATVTGANALTGEANLTFNGSGDFTVKGNDATSANLYLIGHAGDTNGDGWRVGSNQDDKDLTIANNESGSYVDKITILKEGNVGINQAPDTNGGLVQIKNTMGYQDGTTNLLTSASKAALRIRTSNDSSKSLFIGGIDESATPYLQVGNKGTDGATASYPLILNPYGGEVLIGTTTKNASDRFTIVDPGNAFMSLRSETEADGHSQVIDFAVGTGDRSSSNLVSTITSAIPTGAAAGGTLKGYLAFSSNAGDSLAERVRINEFGNLVVGVNPTTSAQGSGAGNVPLVVYGPASNAVNLMIGNSANGTTSLGANDYSGDIRFNGADVAWGDISYYPNGDGNGSFRFTRNGSTVSNNGNAAIGCGGLICNGGIVQNDNSGETAFGNKSLPAADSGYYVRNGNGGTGTYASIGLIASSTAAASDQSASLVAKCTASGLSPEVYLTQRDGNNSQRNVIAINTLGDITVIGGVTPNSDNGQDLGSASKRWANVYTGDMHLNNMNTGGNDVDGSEGHWTMQEGSDDLFLINRNTGKKYKFNLTEVS